MRYVTLTNLDNPALTRQCRPMNDQDPTGKDWNGGEIDLIVADYFDMLQLELSGHAFVKLHRNNALQEITGRKNEPNRNFEISRNAALRSFKVIADVVRSVRLVGASTNL